MSRTLLTLQAAHSNAIPGCSLRRCLDIREAGTRPGSGHSPHVASRDSVFPFPVTTLATGERRRGWGEPWVQNKGPGAWHEVESGLREVTPATGLCHDIAYLGHLSENSKTRINLWLYN